MSLISLLAAANVQEPADQTTTYVILAGAAVFIIYTFMRMNRRKKKDPFDTPYQTRTLAQQRSTERQFENLLVEFSEMSRQMSAQLDTRAAKLEALIQDADEKIARLEALNKQAPARPDFTMPREPSSFPPEPSASSPIVTVKADDVAPSLTIDAEHAEIYRLADAGKPVPAIASELGRPSGEVELILALRPKG
jgi:hypothetical protein